jgi:uncharacterized protein (DUF924 family)
VINIDAHTVLSLILLYDVMARRMYIGTKEMFQYDAHALAWSKLITTKAHEKVYHSLSAIEKYYLIVPLQHSESAVDVKYAHHLLTELTERVIAAHRNQFERLRNQCAAQVELITTFGRDPARNTILGRTHTPEEDSVLSRCTHTL